MGEVKARLVAAALLITGSLLCAPAAGAKDLAAFKVCGARGCTSITDRALLRRLFLGIQAQREAARVSTPSPAPFLRFEYWAMGERVPEPSFVQYYVPSRGVVEVNTGAGSWTWIRPDAANAVFRRVSIRAAPFAAPRISSVTIGGRPVRDPASYSRLFTLHGKSDTVVDKPDWQRIVIRTASPSPWSTTAATLEYSRSTSVLWRGNEFVRIPPSLASRIAARRSLARS
jgi:hypothetical protein